ncbi:MAG: hypothetical protein JXR56_04540 [Candidatus Cloacimonetes bacterium]|nr:hypothetical protein [Candidatus Cloacimonadota bacterium]
MLNKDKYNLPDIELLEQNVLGLTCHIWHPDRTYAVLGASNKAETSLKLSNLKKDEVVVMQRPSGGEAVLLTPNTLTISFLYRGEEKVIPKKFFYEMNTLIIEALLAIGVANLSIRGISDICIGEKKILGCAIYRTGDGIFYQSVLNVAENPELFSRYLKHPEREPDYRKGRDHREFVTSLRAEGLELDIDIIQEEIKIYLKNKIGGFNAISTDA